MKKKEEDKTKVYIRTFYFADGTKETVKTDGEKILRYTGRWARNRFKKDKIKEIKDTVEYV
jgi:hypothetical protein